jgi:membrane protein DedA with SNARE-associated domain
MDLLRWSNISHWLGRQFDIKPSDQDEAPRAGRSVLVLLLTVLAAVWVGEKLARMSLPLLLRDHPLVLIMLDARTQDLLLASAKVGTAEFVIIAVAWRFSVHLLCYLLGRYYGDAALRWAARRSRLSGWVVERIERVFGRVASPAVFLLSDKVVCLLAGSAGMSLTRFVALHLPGTVLHIVAIRTFARSTHRPLGRLVDLLDRNAGWLTVVFAVLTIASIAIGAVLHRRTADQPVVARTPDIRTDEGRDS